MNRREFIKLLGAGAAVACLPPLAVSQTAPSKMPMLARKIPSTDQLIPVIGMGTWQTFNVRDLDDPNQLAPLSQVLKIFFDAGGRVIDSSPMYGSAEDVTGLLSEKLGINKDLFFATKVWTTGKESGIKQMEASLARFRRKSIELMQVHNLVDWQEQLASMRDFKQQGRFRYIGVTHYAIPRFDDLEKIIKTEKIDFVQLPYSVGAREVEAKLLPAARDNGVAVLVMEPFEEGKLFRKIGKKPLPDSVKQYAASWSEALLKWIVANETITAVLPATANPDHMRENLAAGFGRLPDEKERRELIGIIES